MSNEKEKHVQCKLTQDEINKLRSVTNKGTTYEALLEAVKHTIATYDAGV